MQLPVTAHKKLADAAKAHLESSDDAGMLETAKALANAWSAYCIAEAAALEVPFGRLLKTALDQLEAGEIEAVKTCLSTLLMAGDFVPVVDVAMLAPKPQAPSTVARKAVEELALEVANGDRRSRRDLEALQDAITKALADG